MKIKYSILIAIVAAAAIFLYLNRSYAYIYDRLKIINLTSPAMSPTYLVKSPSQNPDLKSIKYAALGDSLTAGVGTGDFQETLPYLIAAQLAKKNDVSLANLGMPGAKTEDVINYQINQAIALAPDYITLFIGINDIHGLVSAKSFETNLQKIINRLASETKAKIIIINVPYLGAANLILPPWNFYFNQKTKHFNEIIKKLSSEKSLCYIDLYQPTKNQLQNDQKFYSPDLFHPSAYGYQLWSAIIYANSDCFSN
ncbi:MAG: SGNH/GDSL hydrolase family protein [Patescibacteria group bacterium]|jgi:lysophospholipase L1-like esterase